MKSREIYTSITSNIEKRISCYREGKINKIKLNEHLVFQICSLCRFFKEGESHHKNKPHHHHREQNPNFLDVFVPFSRLSQSLQTRIQTMNKEQEQQQQKEDSNDLNLDIDFDYIIQSNEQDHDFVNLIDEDDNNMQFDDMHSIPESLFNHPIEASGYDFNRKESTDSSRYSVISTHIKITSQTSQIISDGDGSMMVSKSSIEQEKKREIEEAQEEFKHDIKNQNILANEISEMSVDYLRCMKDVFIRIKGKGERLRKGNDETMEIINKFKEFVLEVGLSDKKFYQQCVREIVYNKSAFEFTEFLECFKKLWNLKFEQTFLKYKCKLMF